MNRQPVSTPSSAAIDAGDLLEKRQRQLRRGSSFILFGEAMAFVLWFFLPAGIHLIVHGGTNAYFGWLAIAAISVGTAASVWIVLAGLRYRRAGKSGSMTPPGQPGKANPRFDQITGTPPASSNAPLNWSGNTLR